MNAAKLPDALLQPPPRLLSDMQIGERAVFLRSALYVDSDGACYLNPGATFFAGSLPPLTLTVERRDDGFHVFVAAGTSWRKEDRVPASYLPVASITTTENETR